MNVAEEVGILKRSRDFSDDSHDAIHSTKKVARTDQVNPLPLRSLSDTMLTDCHDKPRPYPFFHYEDFSEVADPDPTMPLTATGKVPNFPAKMHAMLSRQDLQSIVSWMPHGRSWRVHNPREFEIRVIPVYFEHVKFSSFIRQANGWGFHRITVDSRDRNSYYHPMFLRGLPHLCKDLKRPGVAKKLVVDPEHEPDLHEISKLHPVPDRVIDDSVLLPFTLSDGPKARMPILTLGSVFSNTLPTNVSAIKSTPSHEANVASSDKNRLWTENICERNGNGSSVSASERPSLIDNVPQDSNALNKAVSCN